MMELYYLFNPKLFDVNKIEELEMDTDSLYLGLVEKEGKVSIRPEMKAEWRMLRSKDCVDSSAADAVEKFLPPNELCGTQTT